MKDNSKSRKKIIRILKQIHVKR